MADGEQLSTQDLQDLAQIRKQLPVGHPMYGKIGALVQAHSEQPTQYEKSVNSTEGKGFASGVKESLGSAPESPMKAGVELGIPGIGAAKALWSTIKNAPENYKAGGLAGVAGPLVGIDPQSMRARAERGDMGGVLGEAAIPMAMALSPLASKAAGKLIPNWETVRNVAGDAARKYVGPTLADKLRAPELPPPPPQLSLPSTSSLSTMPSATTGTALRPPVGVGSTTSTSGMPIRFGEAPKAVDPVAQAVKSRTASWLPMKMPEAGSITPSGGGLATETPSVIPASSIPKFTGSEGRPATWTNAALPGMAKGGIRPAIEQMNRRGIPLPENVRYVMGDPDYPRAVYNPKETTIFSPEGTPISNRAPVEKTSKAQLTLPGGEGIAPSKIPSPSALPAAPERPALPEASASTAPATSSAEDAIRKKMADINDRISYTTNNDAMGRLIKQHRELERRLDVIKATQGGTSSYKPPKETFPEHSPEVIEAAQHELRAAVHLWDSLPEPGRFRLDVDEEGFPLPPRSQTWIGTNSPRPDVEALFPWVKTMPGGLSELKRVAQSQKGLIYKRWLEAAARHIEKNPKDYLENKD